MIPAGFPPREAKKTCTACGGTFRASNFEGGVCKACAERLKAEADPGKKKCRRCGRILPLSAFPVVPTTRTGRGARCLKCVSEAGKECKAAFRARREAEKNAPMEPAGPLAAVSATAASARPRRSLPAALPELKPCPFCGRKARLVPVFAGSGPATWAIACRCTEGWNADLDIDADGAELSHVVDYGFETPGQAAKFWNRRPKPAEDEKPKRGRPQKAKSAEPGKGCASKTEAHA